MSKELDKVVLKMVNAGQDYLNKQIEGKYITVLDFEVGKVFQYEAIQPYLQDYEEYLSGLGHNLGSCEWMVHENPDIITP